MLVNAPRVWYGYCGSFVLVSPSTKRLVLCVSGYYFSNCGEESRSVVRRTKNASLLIFWAFFFCLAPDNHDKFLHWFGGPKASREAPKMQSATSHRQRLVRWIFSPPRPTMCPVRLPWVGAGSKWIGAWYSCVNTSWPTESQGPRISAGGSAVLSILCVSGIHSLMHMLW